MTDVLNHRQAPSSVLTLRRVLAATGRLLRSGREQRRDVLAQLVDLTRDDSRHRRLDRRPATETGPRRS